MTGDWPTATIGEIAKVARGGSPRPITKFITNEPDGVNWIKIGDTEKGGRYITGTAEKIIRDGIKRSRWVDEGDFLLTNSMSFGRPYILKTSGCIHDGWLVLKPDYKRINQDFLYYALSSPTTFAQFDAAAAGSTVRNLNIGLVEKVRIPLPPLEEQKRIVAVLDQAFVALDRARALAEANLADAKELFENTLEAVFERFASSELILPLGEAVHPDCRLSYGIVQPGDEVAGGLPIVRPVDLGRPIIPLSGLKRISPDRAEGYSRTTLTGAELLLCVRGTTGEVSMASPELAGANVTRGIVPVRFDPAKVDLEFAYFQMRSPFMRKQIATKTYGAALMQINIKDVRELKFVRPSLDIQQKAKTEVRHLHDRAERLIGDYQAKLDDLALLRQSLLQKAFAGELT